MSQTTIDTNTTTADRRRWAGLVVLAGSLLVVVMDMTILNVAVPALAADLQPSSVELLWVVDIYSLVIAGLLVTVSGIADRWGRRRMLVTGYALFGLASALVLVANSPEAVIAVRALLGLGGAAIMPSTLSMIRTLFPDPRERATALGIWGATAAVGTALGPIVGGVLLEHFSWHAAFLVNVPIMVAALIGALVLLPAGRAKKPAPLDPVATVLSMVGMVALVYAIKQLSKDGLELDNLLIALVAATALTAFVVRNLRRPDPMLDVRLFRGGAFTAGVIAALTTSVALAAVLLMGAQWLQLVEGFSPLGAGFALLPAAVGGALFSPIAPAIAARIGARTVLAGGLAVGGAGFLLLFAAPEPISYPWAAVAFLLIGGSMASLAVGSAMIMAGAPADRAGNAAAIEESAYEIGGALGVAGLGSVGAALYRADLPTAVDQLPPAAAEPVRESLSGAIAVADQLGTAGGPLVDAARAAFTSSFAGVGLVGGVLMLIAAAVVMLITPRDLDLADAQH